MIAWRALALALLITLGTPAWADFYAGVAAYNRDDRATAYREFKPLAEQGHAKAQLLLGLMYSQGQGVAQDYAEAAKWYRKAAEQGDADAQALLGLMYAEGKGITQDYIQAHMWLNLSGARSPPGKDRDMAIEDLNIVEGSMSREQVAKAQKLAREWKPTKSPVSRISLPTAVPQKPPVQKPEPRMAAPPLCRDVGGYEAYMKRTGKVCRLD